MEEEEEEEEVKKKKKNKEELIILKSKINFLRLSSTTTTTFHDFLLYAADSPNSPPLPAHRFLLADRSPVFKAMLEKSEMEECRRGSINIKDVSYHSLRSFLHYLYTSDPPQILLPHHQHQHDDHHHHHKEENEEEEEEEEEQVQVASDLLVLADKYQVQHLKDFCDHFLVSKLPNPSPSPSPNINIINSHHHHSLFSLYSFALRHSAPHLLHASLSTISLHLDSLSQTPAFNQLLLHDPLSAVLLFESYLSHQPNTALPPPPSSI